VAQIWIDLANVLSALGRPGEPMKAALRATALEPTNLDHQTFLGQVLIDQGHLDLAVSTLRNAQAADPAHEGATVGLAMALERTGELDRARELLGPLLDGGCTVPRAAAVFGSVCRRTGDAGRAIPALRAALGARPPKTAIPQLEHELGELLERTGDVDGAFAAHTRGNRALGATFDSGAHETWIKAIERVFDRAALAALPRSTDRSEQPVLVVGMLRSGTSLLERVLAAHPDVAAAGEREELRQAAQQLVRATGQPHPLAARGLTAQGATTLGRWYLERLRTAAGDAARIVDKMPHNLFELGLAALLLPGARVLHCVRDPLDTCWSCYGQNFRDVHAWSSDLGWLAAFHNGYRRMMRHWDALRPLPIMDVRYEQLVTDPEPLVREILDFLGLPFDPACLDHASAGGQVHTASYAQASRPIYRSSVGRAAPFRHHLAPLIEALDA
jgi:tetratricopeptide (TPR) repeat protein